MPTLADKFQEADIQSVGQDLPNTSPAFKVIRKHAEDYAQAILDELASIETQGTGTVVNNIQQGLDLDLTLASNGDILTVQNGNISFVRPDNLTEHTHPDPQIPTPSIIRNANNSTRVDASNANITFSTGSQQRFNLSSNGHLLPILNEQYDIGSAERKIRHLFLSDNSLYLGDNHLFAQQSRPFFNTEAIDRQVYTWTAGYEPDFGQLSFSLQYPGGGRYQIAHRHCSVKSIGVWALAADAKQSQVTVTINYGETGASQTEVFGFEVDDLYKNVFEPKSIILMKTHLLNIQVSSTSQLDAIGVSLVLEEITA